MGIELTDFESIFKVSQVQTFRSDQSLQALLTAW